MSETKQRIIVVDDEPNILLSIQSCLDPKRYQVDTFSNRLEAFSAMNRFVYDCALIDIRLGQDSGIDLFKQMKVAELQIPTIFMSGNASLDEAVASQKLGAYDFIEKPFSAEKLRIGIENCLSFYAIQTKLSTLEQSQIDQELIGEHPLVRQLKVDIGKVAKTDAVVFIHGESGTGKELIATNIHRLSSRAANNFVTVNCSAIPENLIESALFGHTKGAFTGAVSAKKGYFELAHNGSLFLDEIGDMPLAAQTSLLRVLESSEIQKVGADTQTKIDVRVIAASHKNLKEEVAQGNFREDLFYRISVIPLTSPTLRARTSDIDLLVSYLMHKLCKRHGIPLKSVHPECLHVFKQYSWPGNVRELTNTLERMLIMGGDTLLPEDISKDIVEANDFASTELSLKDYRDRNERSFILERLKQYNGNISQVARSLDIDRTNLHKKIKRLNIIKDTDFF